MSRDTCRDGKQMKIEFREGMDRLAPDSTQVLILCFEKGEMVLETPSVKIMFARTAAMNRHFAAGWDSTTRVR